MVSPLLRLQYVFYLWLKKQERTGLQKQASILLLSQVSDNAEFMVFEGEPRVCFHLDQKVMCKIEVICTLLELHFLTEKCSGTICYWFYVCERAWLPQNLDADFK